LKEAEPHSEDNPRLNKEDNKMISAEIMQMLTLFLTLEVEVRQEEE
jgi:hypothetical protein